MLLGLFHVVVVLLMLAVDDGRGCLEASPDGFAQLLGHGACVAVLLVQLLQLVEGRDDVGLVGQALSGFAEAGLELEVLLEVVFAELVVELQQVVELLYVEAVVLPELVGVLLGDELGVVPLLLQLLEFGVVGVGIFGTLDELLQLFDDGELDLVVELFLLLLLSSEEVALLFDDGQGGFEYLLGRVGLGYKGLRIASSLYKAALLGLYLGVVLPVEGLLQTLNLGA